MRCPTGLDSSYLHEVWPDTRNVSGLTRLELVSGSVVGQDKRAPNVLEAAPMADPLEALERALLPAVTKPPCWVAFSGGRDSSVLLAAATRVARREGMPDPIPLTQRWSDIEESRENAWQETVVEHLGLRNWEVIESDEDMDLVGEVASAVLLDHGLMWPPAAHGLLPLQRVASGGTLVLGDGGDQIFAGWRRVYLAEALGRRRRFVLRDGLRAGMALAPRHLRTLAETRRSEYAAGWLRPEVQEAARRDEGAALACEPATWPAFLRWTRGERATVLMLDAWERIGRGVGARLSTPFWEATFLSSLGAWGGRYGRGTRTPLMLALFGDLLPESVLRRGTKACLTRAYFSRASRSFAQAWAGLPPEPNIVDACGLREAWLEDYPPATSASLLQATWLLSRDELAVVRNAT